MWDAETVWDAYLSSLEAEHHWERGEFEARAEERAVASVDGENLRLDVAGGDRTQMRAQDFARWRVGQVLVEEGHLRSREKKA